MENEKEEREKHTHTHPQPHKGGENGRRGNNKKQQKLWFIKITSEVNNKIIKD